MNIRTVSTLSILALGLGVVLVAPPPAAAQGSAIEAKGCKNLDLEAVRGQVPAGQYQEIVSELGERRGGVVDEAMIEEIATSPCGLSLYHLVLAYLDNPAVPKALNAVLAGLQDPPASYGIVNHWKAASTGDEVLRLMVENFVDWCIFLPEINGDQDNGLAYIQRFAWFYYQNQAGRDFVQGRYPLHKDHPLLVGRDFVEQFSKERGEFMFSPASTGCIEQWVSDPRIEIADYQKQKASDYTSWNEFFARKITVNPDGTIPSRPATMPLSEYPKRDYIVVSPTDCIMNPLVQVLVEDQKVTRQYVDNPLQYDTVLDVKGIPISLSKLLVDVPDDYSQSFVGGTGLSCVLMPNTYHHFYAPVNGTIAYAKVHREFGTYGYEDWPNWVPEDGNVGRPGTDFSQFQDFERGVIIIEVTYANVPPPPGVPLKKPYQKELTGYVASIPVGLDTIGSVVLDDETCVQGQPVTRGVTHLGHFYYGGSLNILLFSKGLVSGAVQTRLGNQIGIINAGEAPELPAPSPDW